MLAIVRSGVKQLKGERKKTALLVEGALEEQPEQYVNIDKLVLTLQNTPADPDTKKDAIKMVLLQYRKLNVDLRSMDKLERYAVEGRKRVQKTLLKLVKAEDYFEQKN